MSNGDERKVTSVQEYRRKTGEVKEVMCPSGEKFKVRRLTPIDYIKEGLTDIPNEFFKFVAETEAGVPQKDSDEDTKKSLEFFARYLEVSVTKGIVEPQVTIKYEEEKKDTHLIWAEIEMNDQKYLMDVVNGRINV